MKSTTTSEIINVLHIEDDESLTDLIKELLKKSTTSQFNITSIFNLKDALNYLQNSCKKEEECDLDIILMDLNLPNSSGINTFLRVKEVCSFLPIVIVSGFEDIACKCVELGAQDYLIKPDINTKLLVRSLKYAITRTTLEAKILKSEKKYRELVEATEASIFSFSYVDDRFTYVNDSFCFKMGYTRDEILNMKLSKLISKESLLRVRERYLKLKLGQYISKNTEYCGITKDGKEVWFFVTSDFIEDDKGNIIGSNIVGIDITNRKLEQFEKEKREREIYTTLEQQLNTWNDEIIQSHFENKKALQLIDKAIYSMAPEG